MNNQQHSTAWRKQFTSDDYRKKKTYRATRKAVEDAVTLIPDAYTNDEFFRVEFEQVWLKSWIAVGYISQVAKPGDVLTVEIGDQSLFVVRNREQQLRAYYNVCRHRGSRLIAGDTNCKVIRCPYHGWGYNLDGELLGTPYFKGMDIPPEAVDKFTMMTSEKEGFCKEDYPLLSVAVETWGGIIFLSLDPDPAPFGEWIGDLSERFSRHPLAELELVRRNTYEINANWKLIAENFMEYYHLPWGHPELCNVSGFDNHYRYQGPGMYTGMCTSPLSNDPNTVTFDLPNLEGLNPTESQSAYFVMLFPNIALWMFPHHFLTLLFLPKGSGVTVEHLDMLVHPAARRSPNIDAVIDRILDFWVMVNNQDIKLVENVQRGLRSKAYPGGRLCYHFEEPVHRFQNMLIGMMTDDLQIPRGDDKEEAPRLELPTAAS